MAIEEIDFTEGNEEHKEKGLPEKKPVKNNSQRKGRHLTPRHFRFPRPAAKRGERVRERGF
jgi:hypothetical protein